MDAARRYEREAIQSNPTVNKIDDPRLGWLINADFFHHTCHGPPVSEACRIWRASDHLAMTVAAQVNLTMEHFSAHFFVHTKEGSTAMEIRAGYEISYACAQPTPMIAMLSVHPSRKTALITPDLMRTEPTVPAKEYVDGFGNICHVIHAPAGHISLSSDFLIHDGGSPDEVAPQAPQHSMENLPVDTLVYLLGSRYCETDRFIQFAWSKFGNHPKGWPLVQTICDYEHLQFGYEHANPMKTAWQAHDERRGVCRDFAHLAITLCRCMNIPARYCTGYLGDIGVPPAREPMDFSACLRYSSESAGTHLMPDTMCPALVAF